MSNPEWLNKYFDKYMETFNNIFKGKVSAEVDYSTFKVTELKQEAKSRGIKGYARMRKAELIEILNKN
jgi:hypothetical protein